MPHKKLDTKKQVAEAFNLILATDAAIRLVNAQDLTDGQARCVNYELGMCLDTIYQRPIKRADYSTKDHRQKYRDQKTDILYQREIIPTKDLSEQKVVSKNPKSSQYTQHGKPVINPVYAKRGQAKLSAFSKKVSFSLLNKRGRNYFFQGCFADTDYRPIGILTDVKTMHQKGQRYIWERDTATNARYWFGPNSKYSTEYWQSSYMMCHKSRGQGITLKQLKRMINKRDNHGYQNEMMMGYNKASIKALFANSNDIIDRLRLLSTSHYITTKSTEIQERVKQKHIKLEEEISKKRGKKFVLPKEFKDYSPIKVPLLIIDGNNTPIEYTKSQMMMDLQCSYYYYHSLIKTYPKILVDSLDVCRNFVYLRNMLGEDYKKVKNAHDFAKAVIEKIDPVNNTGKVFDSNYRLKLTNLLVNFIFFKTFRRTVLFLTIGLPVFLLTIIPVLIYDYIKHKQTYDLYNPQYQLLDDKTCKLYTEDDTDGIHSVPGLEEQQKLEEEIRKLDVFSDSDSLESPMSEAPKKPFTFQYNTVRRHCTESICTSNDDVDETAKAKVSKHTPIASAAA